MTCLVLRDLLAHHEDLVVALHLLVEALRDDDDDGDGGGDDDARKTAREREESGTARVECQSRARARKRARRRDSETRRAPEPRPRAHLVDRLAHWHVDRRHRARGRRAARAARERSREAEHDRGGSWRISALRRHPLCTLNAGPPKPSRVCRHSRRRRSGAFAGTASSTARLLCTLAAARALAMSEFPSAPKPTIKVEVYSDLA